MGPILYQAGTAGALDDNLTVDHAALRQFGLDRRDELGEVAGHRPLVAAAQLDFVAVAETDRSESIPFGLVRGIRRNCLD